MRRWPGSGTRASGRSEEITATAWCWASAAACACGPRYVVGEVTPRLSPDSPGAALASFGVEKRVGGHAFQVNVSNGVGSTLAQVARGAASADRWHIGFNINRKFF